MPLIIIIDEEEEYKNSNKVFQLYIIIEGRK